MKSITLEIHSVEIDGMPKESHDNVLVVYPAGEMVVCYSKKHNCFCCRDNGTYSDDELNHRLDSFSDVTHYAVIPSIKYQLKGEPT